MSEQASDSTPQTRYIVFIGKRYYKDKLVDCFLVSDPQGMPIDNNPKQSDENELYNFWIKPIKTLAYAAIGSVYKQSSSDGGKAWTTPGRIADGMCFSEDYVSLWVIRDRSNKTMAERARMQAGDKKEANRKAQAGLDYWKAEYNRAMPARRVAILADVIAYITGRG